MENQPEQTKAIHLSKQQADMLHKLLVQASSPGPSARTLADLYDDVKAAARALGVNVGD